MKNGYVSTKEFCEQLRLKLNGVDPEREDASLHIWRNRAPKWCRELQSIRGETPSETWGRKLREQRKLQKAYRSCDEALEGV